MTTKQRIIRNAMSEAHLHLVDEAMERAEQLAAEDISDVLPPEFILDRTVRFWADR